MQILGASEYILSIALAVFVTITVILLAFIILLFASGKFRSLFFKTQISGQTIGADHRGRRSLDYRKSEKRRHDRKTKIAAPQKTLGRSGSHSADRLSFHTRKACFSTQKRTHLCQYVRTRTDRKKGAHRNENIRPRSYRIHSAHRHTTARKSSRDCGGTAPRFG